MPDKNAYASLMPGFTPVARYVFEDTPAERFEDVNYWVLREIAFERHRQTSGEGFTRAHDDRHKDGDLARAGAAHAFFASLSEAERAALMAEQSEALPYRIAFARVWPWPLGLFKPKDVRRALVIAAAFIVAEIEKIDRKVRKQEKS